MSKWIRWSGVIGFALIVTLVLLLWYALSGPLLRYSIESVASQAVGAKVDVGDASINLFPLALRVASVEVADKDAPMQNLFSFDEALAELEFFPLFLGKAIVPQMQLSGLATATERSYSGALERDEKDDQASDESITASSELLETASAALPRVDEVLARETLVTLERGKAFEESLHAHRQTVEQSLQNLPTEETLKQYQASIEEITQGKVKSLEDFQQRKKQLDNLRAQFKQDRQRVQATKQALNEAKQSLQSQWQSLQDAPAEDLARLREKYQLGASGLGNATALLFGEQATGYARTALKVYQQLAPLIAGGDGVEPDDGPDREADQHSNEGNDEGSGDTKRLEGRYVHFESERPLPELWIKRLDFSVALAAVLEEIEDNAAQLEVSIRNISHQQAVTGLPTTLKANSKDLHDAEVILSASLDHRGAQADDRAEFDISGLALKDFDLGSGKLLLDAQQVELTGRVGIQAAQLGATVNAQFKQLEFSSSESSSMTKELLATLSHVEQLSLEATAEGDVLKPTAKLSSDLDAQLKNAFSKRLDTVQAEWQARLTQKLNAQLLTHSGGYGAELEALKLNDSLVSDTDASLKSLADTKLDAYKDQLKNQANDKLKEKLKGLF